MRGSPQKFGEYLRHGWVEAFLTLTEKLPLHHTEDLPAHKDLLLEVTSGPSQSTQAKHKLALSPIEKPCASQKLTLLNLQPFLVCSIRVLVKPSQVFNTLFNAWHVLCAWFVSLIHTTKNGNNFLQFPCQYNKQYIKTVQETPCYCIWLLYKFVHLMNSWEDTSWPLLILDFFFLKKDCSIP